MCLLLLAEESKASFENPGLPSVLLSHNRRARRTTQLETIYPSGLRAEIAYLALRAKIRGDVGFVVGVALRFQLRVHQLAIDFDLK